MTAEVPDGLSKPAIRHRALTSRVERPLSEQREAAFALRERVLSLREMAAARTVAAYVSAAGEPGTGPLLDALHHSKVTVLLPILRPDFYLDWACYQPGEWREGRFRISEPAGPALGIDAIIDADVVVCPGVAGDASGGRLGRGGGSYDRVLARVVPPAVRCLLLYDDELVAAVPTVDHDEPVDVIVTPTRTIRAS